MARALRPAALVVAVVCGRSLRFRPARRSDTTKPYSQ